MTPQMRKALRWVGYPLFYLLSLLIFVRLTFPYERVKDRIIAEFEASQKEPGKRLEIDELSGYWLFGIEAEGVRLISEPPAHATSGKKDEKAPAARVLAIDSVEVSVAILRRLFGTLYVTFSAEIGGGEIEGTFIQDDQRAEIEVEGQDVNVAGLSLLEDVVELPLEGTLAGTVHLVLPEGKMKLAEGDFELSISDLAVGDGKAKIRDTIALPKLRAGDLNLKAEASEGRLDVKELSAKGPDFELSADGNIRLRDPFDRSLSDLNVGFKFADAYKNKNDMTRGLFGAPGSKVPGLFDLDPKIKRAKADDGFYRWRVGGALGQLNFRPSPRGTSRNARRTAKPKADEKK